MAHNMFMHILSSALAGNSPELPSLNTDVQSEILRLADIHRVLPLVYDSMYACGITLSQNTPVHSKVKLLISQQTLHSLAFEQVYKTLRRQGISPIIVKGVVCRNLYPKPDFRISSDEDLLVSSAEYPRLCKLLTEMGFSPSNEKGSDHYQHSFRRSDGVHLEIHTSLFDTQNSFFENWNKEFEESERSIFSLAINETEFLTLPPTKHLIYLILHALKHFIHSGVGIRQVCDIVMFANHHREDINWQQLIGICKNLNALKFAMGIFAIGRKHLNLSDDVVNILLQYASFPKNENPLLNDILSAGIYGSATLSRKHSSSIAFTGAQGKSTGVIRQVFPPAKSLGRKYSYAKKSPVLLPVAWGQRLFSYSKEINHTENNNPFDAVRIGKNRLKLFKEYGIIKDR